MASSVLLYTILFTLEDKPVHKNKYIQMFLIWLSFLVKSKSLNTFCTHYKSLGEMSDNNIRILIDCCGRPGHYIDHMEKMLNILCITNAEAN